MPPCSPAKAGAQTGSPPSRGNMVEARCPLSITTPAEAGAQLGDGDDDVYRFVTLAFPIGPRPSPGWRSCLDGVR